MRPVLPLLPLLSAGLFALAGATGGHAQLAKTSPFMPAQAAPSSAPTAGAPLEFRGFLKTAEGTLYRVNDPARKTGSWVKLNERDPTLEVLAKAHDPDQNTLTVEYQGKTLTLAGREAKIVSSGSAAQPMPVPMPAPAPPPTNVAPAVTQSVVVNPTPADEQRRLEAVAAEVARRRALREQAAQQAGPGGAAPMIPPPPPVTVPPQRTVPQALPPAGFARPGMQPGTQGGPSRGPGPQQR